MSGSRRSIWWALWPIGIAAVVAGELGFVLNDWRPHQTMPLHIAVGVSSIVAGLLVWRRRPDNKIGLLLYLVGVVWALSGIFAYINPWTFAVSQTLTDGEAPILAHALLAYPIGRITIPWQRWFAVFFYLVFPLHLIQVMTFNPAICACPPNAFFVWDNLAVHNASVTAADLLAVSGVIGIAILVGRWIRATPTGRRVYTPVLAGGLFFAAGGAVSLVMTMTGTEPPMWVLFWETAARIILPLTFVFGLLRGTIERLGVGDLVVRLGAEQGAESLREALARTLRDPSLALAYWVPEREDYVDVSGRSVALPDGTGERVATQVERDGERLAAIIHDRAVLENPALVESVTAAAKLALDNERLQAALRAQLEEVRASRARIVEAGDDARRRIERDLHDGAQQRLLSLAISLRMARDRVSETADQEVRKALQEAENDTRMAIHELRELAQGIHPAVLTQQGLFAAIEMLAEKAPVPVRIEVLEERFNPAIEATAYFVIAEGLSNVMKYARASRVSVRTHKREGTLVVEVEDDGIGGADAGRGSGLGGLEDRVAALGGRLVIESPVGTGTLLRADIPCG